MTDLDAIERRLRRLEANPSYVDDWLEWDDCRTLLKEVRRLQRIACADLDAADARLKAAADRATPP